MPGHSQPCCSSHRWRTMNICYGEILDCLLGKWTTAQPLLFSGYTAPIRCTAVPSLSPSLSDPPSPPLSDPPSLPLSLSLCEGLLWIITVRVLIESSQYLTPSDEICSFVIKAAIMKSAFVFIIIKGMSAVTRHRDKATV